VAILPAKASRRHRGDGWRWFTVITDCNGLSSAADGIGGQLDTDGFVDGVWFAPGDEELTVINRGGIEWWDTATWRRKRREAGTPVSGSYVIMPQMDAPSAVTNFRDAVLYDRASLDPIMALPPNVLPLALSGDSRQLAVGVEDQRVQLWDLVELRTRLHELGLDW